ncbi:MAG: hypothetical protein Kow0088_21950 [Anaerolineales bacterium]
MKGINPETVTASPPLSALHKRWLLTALSYAGFLVGMNLLLSITWSAPIHLRWMLAALAFCIYVLAVLWKALPLNYRVEDGYFFPYFGAGNIISLLRAGFLAALAGFLIAPPPAGWLAWLPGIFYISNGVADLFDGYLARRSRQVTKMGERLDMSLDGFGVLFAAILLYSYGTLPSWILLVGAARFLFLAVAKLREAFGKPVYPLSSSSLRRALAGAQMGYLGAALLPVFTPPATVWAGAFFSFPFLLHFGWDILISCGFQYHGGNHAWLLQRFDPQLGTIRRLLFDWLPLGLRVFIGFLVATQFLNWSISPPAFLTVHTPLGSTQTQFQLLLLFYTLGALSTVLGMAGRGGAALLLIGVGLQQGILPLGWQGTVLLFAACVLFFLGSGRASLWKPEERLIWQRWGET